MSVTVFGSRKKRFSRLPSRRTRRSRLQVELLEDRSLLSHGTSAFSYDLLATLGDAAPGGGTYAFDFEPYEINNSGQVLYGADLFNDAGAFIGEGIFLRDQAGNTLLLARSGDPAPGGGTYGGEFFGPGLTLNDRGDAAYPFALTTSTPPSGLNGPTFRFAANTGTVTPVFIPGVTPAPGAAGSVFRGSTLHPSLNNSGDLAFAALVTQADISPGPPGIDGQGLGVGVFLQRPNGSIAKVLRPGDPAPGGVFDLVESPWINDRGDIAFGAHIAGEECITTVPQTTRIVCFESIYLRTRHGEVISIAHQGQAVPASAGGGTYRLAFGPVVNNRQQVVFLGDLTPAPDLRRDLGIFLWEDGTTIAIARPGTPLPGGGTFTRASFFQSTYDLNERGDVTFAGSVDTDGDGVSDATGVYQWTHGELRLVARTGTEIPGVGVVRQIQPPGGACCSWPRRRGTPCSSPRNRGPGRRR